LENEILINLEFEAAWDNDTEDFPVDLDRSPSLLRQGSQSHNPQRSYLLVWILAEVEVCYTTPFSKPPSSKEQEVRDGSVCA
jgi:hypothetical protein